VTLVEVLPELVERARSAATQVKADVQVVAADAGCSQTYVGLATVLPMSCSWWACSPTSATPMSPPPWRPCHACVRRGPRCCGAEVDRARLSAASLPRKPCNDYCLTQKLPPLQRPPEFANGQWDGQRPWTR
jgi:hypothetical protein